MRVLFVIAALAWTAFQAPQQDTNATVEGTVTRLTTGEPIAGIPVFIGDQMAPSDREGRFVVTNVPPGTYRLGMQTALGLGYFAPPQGGGPTSLTVSAGEQIKDLHFKLIGSGIVSGRILRGNGEPLIGALVQADRITYQTKRRFTLGALTLTPGRTDDRGEYRISGLEPGEYYIRARNTPEVANSATYFPGTIDPEKAVMIRVKEGEEVSRIDFVSQPATERR